MLSIRSSLLLTLLLPFAFMVYAQEPEASDTLSDSHFQNVIEDVVSQTETSIDFSDLNNQGLFGTHRRININKATDRQLKQLKLNEIQIAKLREYIANYGELSGMYELNLVEGFDSAMIIQINPFIVYALEKEVNIISPHNLAKKGRHTFMTRYGRDWELAKGYVSDSSGNATYAGNPDKILLKYTYNYYDRLKIGFTLEKDAGESMSNGFDYSSWHILYRSKKYIRTLALGNYNLRFGQGLTMNTGFNTGRSISYPVVRSLSNSVSANTSANEGMGLTGLATTVNPLKGVFVTAFYSSTNPDARLNDSDSLKENYFTSLNETGLHRTATEILRKNAIDVKAYGGNVRFSHGMVSVGATAFKTDFSSSFHTTSKPYELYDFTGKSLMNFGTDFSFTWNAMNVFAEVSGSDNGGKAYITGIHLTPAAESGISVSWHDYSPNYQNFYSSAFSEGSGCRNERGLYAAFLSNIGKHWTISANASQFSFPWLKYRVDAPSKGSNYAFQFNYKWYSKNEVIARFTCRTKMQNTSLSGTESYLINTGSSLNNIDYPVEYSRYAFRINLQYRPHIALLLRNRIEYQWNDNPVKPSTDGYLIYQDLIYSPLCEVWSVNLRYALFDTDTYDDRIYAYENDVLYAWSVPAYYYRGSKLSLMIHYKISRSLGLWMKYSKSYYSGRATIGTGYETINSNSTSDIKLQLIVKI